MLSLLFLSSLAVGITTPPADPAMVAADHIFVQAIGRSDAKVAVDLLDKAFTWTTANGASLDVERVRQALPKPALIDQTIAQTKQYGYGQVGIIQVDAGKLHSLRVWVKRPEGWRLLVFQEVRSLDGPPTATPGTGATCENPCGTVPYTPKTENERGVMEAYRGLEEAATSGKADVWRSYAAAEIALVSSNSDRVFDKPTRAAAVQRATLGGVAPTRLLSARLFDFGTSVVMTSQHQPDRGDLLHITRVWVKRDGR